MDTEIMERSKAHRWLARCAKFSILEFADGHATLKETRDIVEDILGDIELTNFEDWAWVAIEECPMSISNIIVREATREEIQNATKR